MHKIFLLSTQASKDIESFKLNLINLQNNVENMVTKFDNFKSSGSYTKL